MGFSLKSLFPGADRLLSNMRAECALRSCPNQQLMRCIPQTRQGIRVGQQWYCCVDCFAIAARTPLAALSNVRVVEIPRNPRLSLGLVMLSKGYLTSEQLRSAVRHPQWSDEELEEALIRLGLANEKQITAARAAQWGYPILAEEALGHMVEADIPQRFLGAFSAAPMHYSATARRVVLGFVRRVEHSLLEAVELATGCRAEPCFITPTEYEEQLERITVSPDYKEIVVSDPGTSDKMARTVGRSAVEVAATEAWFTQCKGHIWARVAGKRGKIDLIFRMGRESGGARTENSTGIREFVGSIV